MQGHNGIYWGWNPDIENGVNISMINKATGKKASTYEKLILLMQLRLTPSLAMVYSVKSRMQTLTMALNY